MTARLVACLESLSRLDYPADRFEAIVIVGGNGDPPEAALARLRGVLDLSILTQPHAGPAAARNGGASLAKGPLFASIDDDCVPTLDRLHNLAARFAVTPDHAIGGRTAELAAGNLYSGASQLLIDYPYSHYNPVPDRARFLASNNPAVPAKLFREIGIQYKNIYVQPLG